MPISLAVVYAQLQLAGAPAPLTAPDSVLIKQVANAEVQFLLAWRRSWALSEGDRHRIIGNVYGGFSTRIKDSTGVVRWANTIKPAYADTFETAYWRPENRVLVSRCGFGWQPPSPEALRAHPGVFREGDFPSAAVLSGWSIKSQRTNFTVCPSWYLGPENKPPWDERLDLDASLSPSQKPAIAEARRRLIRLLDSAAAREPHNNWLAGQRVRFLVDERQFETALTATTACAAEAWWCGLLRGYVLASMGRVMPADSAFDAARRSMNVNTRCLIDDVSMLLEPPVRSSYAQLSCADKDSVNRVIWWLAHPLWSTAVSDRKVEHYSRRVLLLLKSGLPMDERFDLRSSSGSDAREEMVLRYGWPSYMYWRGVSADSQRSYFLEHPRNPRVGASPPNIPYVSYEYGAGRMHLFPSAKAVFAPFAAEASDWSLNPPPGGDAVIGFKLAGDVPWSDEPGRSLQVSITNTNITNNFIAHEDEYHRNVLWWPTEHFMPRERLLQLSSGEVALLRRDDSVLVVTSNPLVAENLDRRSGDTVDSALLITSAGPDTFQRSDSPVVRVGSALVLRQSVLSEPLLVGVEIPATATAPAARTRFAIAPPPTLTSMKRGEIAISPLLMLDASASARLSTTPDSLLSLLSPGATIAEGSRLTLYWETYGFKATDSIALDVRIRRTNEPGLMSRVSAFVQRSGDSNTPVNVHWTQTALGSRNQQIPSRVGIITHVLTLDTSKLRAGDYELEVAAALGDRSAKSQKTIQITKRQ